MRNRYRQAKCPCSPVHGHKPPILPKFQVDRVRIEATMSYLRMGICGLWTETAALNQAQQVDGWNFGRGSTWHACTSLPKMGPIGPELSLTRIRRRISDCDVTQKVVTGKGCDRVQTAPLVGAHVFRPGAKGAGQKTRKPVNWGSIDELI